MASSPRPAASPYDEAPLARPFHDVTLAGMREKAKEFLEVARLPPQEAAYVHGGALLAKDGRRYRLRGGDDDDPEHAGSQYNVTRDNYVLVNEQQHRLLELETRALTPRNLWSIRHAYPPTTYFLIMCCSLGAAVQGFDETAINGAQVFFKYAFGIDGSPWTLGLVNAAPYLVAGVVCLLNHPVNYIFRGRRRVICLTCAISSAACLGQFFPMTWQGLLAARLVLGLGIGLKSATIPIYASECAPAKIRGALVMMWQLWTAFGLLLGYAFGIAFLYVDNECAALGQIEQHCALASNNWRFMLASPMVLPLIPMVCVLFLPESPRFLLQRAHREDDPAKKAEFIQTALNSLERLNKTKLQARREVFYIYYSLEKEPRGRPFHKVMLYDMWTQPRTRRALIASVLTMFLQQLCGVNVLAYYSTTVLNGLNNNPRQVHASSFKYSLGFGVINFAIAFPAIWLMDTLGRRRLLLLTFPLLGFFQILTGIAVGSGGLKSRKVANKPLAITAIYLFCAAYSIGEGPVPFVYASESMPLYHRDYGMGVSTCVEWLFNAILAWTWPAFLEKARGIGAFATYGVFCFMGFFLVLVFVRETKKLPLEEMSNMFEAPTALYVHFAKKEFLWAWRSLRKLSRNFEEPSFARMVDEWKDSQRGVREEEIEMSSHGPTEIGTDGSTSGTSSSTGS